MLAGRERKTVFRHPRSTPKRTTAPSNTRQDSKTGRCQEKYSTQFWWLCYVLRQMSHIHKTSIDEHVRKIARRYFSQLWWCLPCYETPSTSLRARTWGGVGPPPLLASKREIPLTSHRSISLRPQQHLLLWVQAETWVSSQWVSLSSSNPYIIRFCRNGNIRMP